VAFALKVDVVICSVANVPELKPSSLSEPIKDNVGAALIVAARVPLQKYSFPDVISPAKIKAFPVELLYI
tara:strand:+ start:420 stop:629 length:210 start_codon:yes stop_codon:yes gene_type:complete